MRLLTPAPMLPGFVTCPADVGADVSSRNPSDAITTSGSVRDLTVCMRTDRVVSAESTLHASRTTANHSYQTT